MKMEAFGILDALWKPHSGRDPMHCLRIIQQQLHPTDKIKNRYHHNSRLTLNGLSGAFVILGLGYLVSIFVFIIEHIVARRNKRIAKVKEPIVIKKLVEKPMEILAGTIHQNKVEQQPSVAVVQVVEATPIKAEVEPLKVEPILAVVKVSELPKPAEIIAKEKSPKVEIVSGVIKNSTYKANDVKKAVTVVDVHVIGNKNQPNINKEGSLKLKIDDESPQVNLNRNTNPVIDFDLIEEILED